MITKAKLNNFRQHSQTMIEFVPGVNTIVGLNNSGKSTIPEAIEFALYGSRALRDGAKGFIRDGESDGAAIIELKLKDDTYVVGRNSRNAEVRKNGELDARYKENVTGYMAQVTGVNQTGYRLGHYVRQKELSAFSALRPGKRHETVEKMLKVNAVDKAIKRLKDETDELEIQNKTLLSSYTDVEAMENEIDDIKSQVGGIDSDTDMLTTRLSKLKADLDELHEKRLHLAKKPELARLRLDLKDCEQAAVLHGELRAKLDALDPASDEAYKALRNKVEAERAQERASINAQAKKREIDALNPVAPVPVEEPAQPSSDKLNELSGDLRAAINKRVDFEKLKAAADCPCCLRRIPPEFYEEVLERLLSEETALAGQLQTVRGEHEAAEVVYKSKLKEYNNYRLAKHQYDADSRRREQLLMEYVEVTFDPAVQLRLNAELEEMRLVRENRLKLDGELRAAAARVERGHNITARIAELAYLDGLEDDASEEQLNVIKSAVQNHEANLRKLAADKARLEGRAVELTRSIAQMHAVRARIAECSQAIADKNLMRENFVLFKRYLTAKIKPLLQQVAEALFHKTTKNRYSSYNLSSDYEISLVTHRGYARKLATISGSENDLACLCLRLAIATLRSTKLAGSLGFIVLDEISGSFDDERTKQTLEGLLELRDVIPQIINITHKPVEMRFADRLITVKEVNGEAKVTYE